MIKLIRRKQLDLSVIEHIKYKNSRNGLSKTSKSALLAVGKRYNSYLKTTRQYVDSKSISGFLEQEKAHLAKSSWNVIRQRLKKVIKSQSEIRNYEKRILVDEIFYDIKPLRQDKSVVDYLSYNEVLKLILGSPNHLALIIEFLYKTGSRISELTAVRLIDIRVDKQVQITLTGKGSKLRKVFISHTLYNRIRKEFKGLYYLFENSRNHRYDRSNLFKQIRAAGRSILAKDIHPHLLRHSTANYLLKEQGKSVKFVGRLLGHSNSSITNELYIHESIDADMVDLFDIPSKNRKTIKNK